MSQQVTGIVIVKVDGQTLRSMPGAKLDVGGFERKSVIAAGLVVGYVNSAKASTVSCELTNTADMDISQSGIGAIVNATLEFICDNGPIYQVSGAYATKTAEITESADGAKVAVEFQGPPAVLTS